jgi:hypothetical protein
MMDQDEKPSLDVDLSKVPWPIVGDKLFAADDDDWWHNACLHFSRDEWDLYATGYKDAADLIIERVIQTRQGMDTLIYPAAFLYRHYLELRLKELIIHAEQLLDLSGEIKHLHRIDLLWISARRLLEQVWPDGPKPDLDVVSECIKEFCELDSQSMSFRYPVTKDGAETLPGVKHINLRHLMDVMARVASLLEGASMGISAYLDDKWSHHSENYQ